MSENRDAPLYLADWTVAILAGGLATRLKPITEVTPKALLPVAGKPFVAHQLRLLQRAGFRRVVFCAGHLGERIEEYVGDGSRFGMSVRYVYDGPILRGTGGAVQNALPELGAKFVLLYGDSYLLLDYYDIVKTFAASGKPALMTVFKNDGRWDRSNVLFEGGKIRCYNKRVPTPDMRYIEYGVSALKAEALNAFQDQQAFDLAEVYHQLVEARQVVAYEVTQRFYEIGSREGLEDLDVFLRENVAHSVL